MLSDVAHKKWCNAYEDFALPDATSPKSALLESSRAEVVESAEDGHPTPVEDTNDHGVAEQPPHKVGAHRIVQAVLKALNDIPKSRGSRANNSLIPVDDTPQSGHDEL